MSQVSVAKIPLGSLAEDGGTISCEIACGTIEEFANARETGHEIITPGETVRFLSPGSTMAWEISFRSLGVGWGKPRTREFRYDMHEQIWWEIVG
jgi:hypothetical protein